MVKPGQVIYSISGRDAGRYFLAVDIEGNFVYICDGKLRQLEKMKKKNIIHVKVTEEFNCELRDRIKENKATNKEIRKYLNNFYHEQS